MHDWDRESLRTKFLQKIRKIRHGCGDPMQCQYFSGEFPREQALMTAQSHGDLLLYSIQTVSSI